MSRASDFLTIDSKAWSQSMRDLQYSALPRALKSTLNEAAFIAQKELPKAAERILDRPSNFTQKAWLVDKAKAHAGLENLGKIESRLYSRKIQGQYLAYIIFGSTRSAGEPGAWPKDVPVGVKGHLDKLGGWSKSLLMRIQKSLAEEKKLRAAGFSRIFRKGRYEGWFFGTVGLATGYWKRPRRKDLVGPKKKGVRRAAHLGTPELQLAVEEHTEHKPVFREAYDRTVNEAMAAAVTYFPEALAYQLSKTGKGKSKKPKGVALKKPDFLK